MTEIYTFTKTNGQHIAAKAYIPDGDLKQNKYPLVIFSHGFGSNYRELEHHGQGFADAGVVCVFFDFCGGGQASLSDGEMTEMSVLTEQEDLECVIDEVCKWDFVDETKLFMIGESMGGFVSAIVGAKIKERIKGMILWYPAFVIPDDSKSRYVSNDNEVFGLQLSPKYNIEAKDIDINRLMKAYPGPVLLIHGDKDQIVPISFSERAEKLYPDAKLIVIHQAGHGFDGADSKYARHCSVEFVKEHL